MAEITNESMTNLEATDIPQPTLKWDAARFATFARSYDSKRDILFVYEEPKRPAVSVDVAGEAWVRFDPDTEEVVGVEIDDFEKVFLARHPELKLGWDQVKPSITRKIHRDSSPVGEYLRFLLSKLQEWLNTGSDNFHHHQPKPA